MKKMAALMLATGWAGMAAAGGLALWLAAAPAGIAVAPIPDHGLGEAINDRLRRAAAPRQG